MGTPFIAVFVNMSSGLRLDLKNEHINTIKKCFREESIHVKIIKVFDTRTIPAFVKNLAKEGYTTFVAAGGDGTISAVAAELVHSSHILGVLPLGTMNNFAKTLRIPLDLSEAVKIILHRTIKKIDVAEVNKKIFVNNSSIGIYSALVRKKEKELRYGKNKILAFMKAIFHVFQHYPLLMLQLVANNVQLTRTTPIVFVGNNIYKLEKKFELGTREHLDQNLLSVFLTKEITRFEFIKLFLNTLFAAVYREKNFDFFATKELQIHSKKAYLHVVTDGEVGEMATPLHYKIHPRALIVIVPPSL